MFLQDHLENCREIPLPCPISCGHVIPREMVNAFYFSLSDVIKDRSIASSQGFYLAGKAVGCLSLQLIVLKSLNRFPF